jgi:hypothetical protein
VTRLLTLVPLIFDSDKVTKYHWYHLFSKVSTDEPDYFCGLPPTSFSSAGDKDLPATNVYLLEFLRNSAYVFQASLEALILQQAVCKHQTFSFSESAGDNDLPATNVYLLELLRNSANVFQASIEAFILQKAVCKHQTFSFSERAGAKDFPATNMPSILPDPSHLF